MQIKTILLCLISCVIIPIQVGAVTHEPLYIVGGVERPADEVDDIPPAEIEEMKILPADEESIAKYGDKASNGVVLITLRYDTRARFPHAQGFSRWVAEHTEWDEDEQAARIVIRYRITVEGVAELDEVLEATDRRLLRRVIKVAESAPRWTPAMKEGKGVESTTILRVQLPEGKPMPRQAELVIR